MASEILSHRKRQFHGHRWTTEYNSWRAMWERCTNQNYRKFNLYGGRGITICERWRDFVLFLQDMGPKPSRRHSLDRIDGNGNYEPSNCRWATSVEQRRNTSRNKILTLNGESMCVSAWSEKTGIPISVLVHRFQRGWTVERALTQPAKKMPKIFLEYNGKRQCMRQWSKELGINYSTIHQRYMTYGWSAERALSTTTL